MRPILAATALLIACAAAPARADGGMLGEKMLRCESADGARAFCAADTRGGVRLARELSDDACREDRSWGVRGDGVWVDAGCRAEFVLGYGGTRGDGAGGQVLRCESRDSRWTRCAADVRDGVDLVRQLSESRCRLDQTWGFDRHGVWVAGGCRGDFRVRGAARASRGPLRCESKDNAWEFCAADVDRGVRLDRQLSKSPCVKDESWGTQRGGIWVDRGCRAEFQVGGAGHADARTASGNGG